MLLKALACLLLKFISVYCSQAGCIHGGVKFKHGDHFLPSDPMLRSDLPGQCVQCRCQEGLVICEMENCPRVDCNTPIRLNHFCCPQCPGVANAQESPSSLTFPTKSSHARSKNGCISGSKFYAEGSSWQPVIGPLGMMACVQCSCKSHQINCQRFPCHEPPCSRPKKQFGYCCPVCPSDEDIEKDASRCLPSAAEVIVYKTPTNMKMASVIEFGFVLHSARNKLELHSWKTMPAGALTINMIPKTEMPQFNLGLIGATSYKHWVRFTRREKRLEQRCFSQCAEKVNRLQQTLKLYPVGVRARCFYDEIDAASV